ncbi:MAG: Hsp20/alpha crystallin family protein [Anaerolineae bacterium]
MSLLRRRSDDFVSLRDAMNRLLEESWVRPFGEGFGPQVPAVDMIDKEDHILVKATVPGLKAEDLEITTVGNTLTIKGEVKEEKEEGEEDRYIYRERRYGAFCRSFTLPEEIDADKAEAEFEDGILTLQLPKAESAKRKSITVKAKK